MTIARRLLLTLMSLPAVTVASFADTGNDLRKRIAAAPQSHPRLFFGEKDTAVLRRTIRTDPLLAKAWSQVKHVAEILEKREPVRRKKTGRRLLGVSRECLKRVTHLAMAYRLTGDRRCLKRVEKEMLAAAGFTDWNPSHFLDVAEMTAALAIGYDWVYNGLDSKARETIKSAIITKGLKTSLKGGWWVKTTNNWNQVCHGGLVLGALAVLEDEPDLATTIINRAINNVPRAMHEYAPDGAYPEGPGYWKYGTTYNVVLLAALESVLGTDFGLSNAEGFMDSAGYYLHVTGPSRQFFNYSDCGRGDGGPTPAMYWFAAKTGNRKLLFLEKDKLERFLSRTRGSADRLFPLLLVWSDGFDGIDPPAACDWKGGGKTPVAFHRSGWSPEATFVGIKGGSPGTNHAHMDIGTFVVDARGVRWAEDLGAQSYHSLESKGINLWSKRQNSERWTVFRLNNRSHNTLVVDDRLQLVKGHGKITDFSPESRMPHTTVDLGPVYADRLAGARRGAALLGDGSVLIQDEITAGKKEVVVRWGMVTKAAVETIDTRTAILRRDKQIVTLRVLAPAEPRLELFETAKPPAKHDAPNRNTVMVGFNVRLENGAGKTLAVHLIPGEKSHASPAVKPLSEW